MSWFFFFFNCIQPDRTLVTKHVHWQWFFSNNPALLKLKFHLLHLQQNFMQAWQITALLLSLSRAWEPPRQLTYFTSAWFDCRLSLVLAYSWLICLPSWLSSLLSTGPCLVDATDLEISPVSTTTTTNKQTKRIIFCIVFQFHDILLSCETCNKWWETSNVAGDWHRQWTTSDLIWCHPPRPGSCQSWYGLPNDFTPQHQRDRDWAREKGWLRPLIKTHSVSYIYWAPFFFFFSSYSKHRICTIMWVGFILHKQCIFSCIFATLAYCCSYIFETTTSF